MRFGLLFGLVFALSQQAGAAVGFSFHTSRIGSLFKMLEVLSQHRLHHPYYTIADSSRMMTPEIRKRIDLAGQADWETIRYQSQPTSRQIGRSTLDFFRTAACKSRTIAELRDRTTGYLPLVEQQQVIDGLQALAPLFDKLVWNPGRAHLDSQRTALASYASAHDLSTFFAQAIRFYGAAMPDTMDYQIYLNPVPRGFYYSTAQPFQSLLVMDMPWEDKNWAGGLSVIFHEVCHVLYAEQASNVQHTWEKLMLPEKGSARFRNGLPYAWIDEALATAVGNGTCYKYLTGRLDTADWYYNATIDGYAHVLYPEVSRMLEQGRSLASPSFRDTAVAAFYRRFPDAMREPERVFPFYCLIGDTLDFDDWHRTLGPKVQGRYTQTCTPLDENAFSLLEGWHGLGVIVVQRKNEATWARLGKRLPDVAGLTARKNRKSLGAGKGWYVFEVGKSGRPWMLINAATGADVKAALGQMAWEKPN